MYSRCVKAEGVVVVDGRRREIIGDSGFLCLGDHVEMYRTLEDS